MYSDEELASAVRAGILTEEALAAIREHVAQLRNAPAVDEEHFRLITGFNDIFVVIACLLLLLSVAWIGGDVAPSFGTILLSATAWALAEFFIRKRRMALPSIVLLLSFVGGLIATGLILLRNSDLNAQGVLGVSCALAATGAWAHWLRFKVPITVAAGTATLVVGGIALLFATVPELQQWANTITFAAGAIVFAMAIRWDASDIARQTRRSDVAFWLHIVAAPLLVHPIFSSLEVFEAQSGVWQAATVAALYVVIALVSISVDRRALMVSALIYVLYAFNALLKHYGAVSLSFALTAFIIGVGLLLLSAFWHPCRGILVRFYPSYIQKRIPPLH